MSEIPSDRNPKSYFSIVLDLSQNRTRTLAFRMAVTNTKDSICSPKTVPITRAAKQWVASRVSVRVS